MTKQEKDKIDLVEKVHKASLSLLKEFKSLFSKDTPKNEFKYLKDVFERKKKPKYKLDELNVLEDKEGHFTTHWISGYTNTGINIPYVLNKLISGISKYPKFWLGSLAITT